MSDTQAKAQGVLDKILVALEKLETLRIETAVVDLEMVPSQDGPRLEPKPGPAKGIVTEIGFIRGDIQVRLSPALEGEAGKDLIAGHLEHVKQSQEIVSKNITALVSLVRELAKE